jgi:hypothetical protein
MKGKIFAVIIAAVIGFTGVEGASAQRARGERNGPHGSVQVSNTGYGTGKHGHGPRRHFRQRHHGYGGHHRHHVRHQRVRHHQAHGHHGNVRHRSNRNYR